ncbi:endonuclease III domain-containing protein [Phycisphaeraceae bacterium D3-23]
MPTKLTLPVPRDFELYTAVCSYGHFLLAPTRWDKDKQQLHRVLRDGSGRIVRCRVVQQKVGQASSLSNTGRMPVPPQALTIHCDRTLHRKHHGLIKQKIVRMLRIDTDLRDWYKLCPAAKKRSFGRLFRGENLFEDIVKTITSCNVTWPNTVNMNAQLVEHVGHGGFPTPEQVADFGEARLKSAGRVGYRAGRIVQLARGILDGSVDLDWFEQPERTSDECFAAALKLYGIGPYAAANILMLLGHYDRLAIDTETYRHYCKTHNVRRPKDPLRLHKRIDKHYGQFAPYPFLAYWFELWQAYEDRFGPSHHWDAEADAKQFTASNL